jgi:hypothetical protein
LFYLPLGNWVMTATVMADLPTWATQAHMPIFPGDTLTDTPKIMLHQSLIQSQWHLISHHRYIN